MKKGIIAILVLLLLGYFAQVYLMSNASAKIYDSFTKYKSPYYTIENSNFEKGFFDSKASLLLKLNEENIKQDLIKYNSYDYKVGAILAFLSSRDYNISLNFKNNIFANENIIAILKNPFKNEKFKQDDLLRSSLAFSLSSKIKGDLKVQVYDINISENNDRLVSKDLYLILKNIDENFNYEGSEFNLAFFEFSSKSSFFNLKNLKITDELKSPISLARHYDLNSSILYSTIQSLSLESSKFREGFTELELSDMNLSFDVDADETLSNSKLKLDIKELLSSGQSIKNLNLDADFKAISQDWLIKLANDTGYDYFFADFVKTKPNILLNNLSFNIYGSELLTKGSALFDKEKSEAKLNVILDKRLSEINPIFAILNFDRYFVEKDGSFVMDLNFVLDKEKSLININGKDLHSNDILTHDFVDENATNMSDENLSDEEGVFNGEVMNPNSIK